MSSRSRISDKTYAVGDAPWLYPHRNPPPKGVKLFLLNKGGVATLGEWSDGFSAWQYLYRRDRQQEDEMKVLAMEMLMDEPKKFRVPTDLPYTHDGWTKVLNARWTDPDCCATEVAAIYKLVDAEGYVTPITFQFDNRDKPLFASGYGILNTGRVYKTWSELRDRWPSYLEMLEETGSEAAQHINV
jgi:hypothetical protein